MSSVIRSLREPISIRNQYTIHAYGIPNDTSANLGSVTDIQLNYFTVTNNILYRHPDTASVWMVVRDMGTQHRIDVIDPALIQVWQTYTGWQNIRVIRPGIARKYQMLSMTEGDRPSSYFDYAIVGAREPEYNSGSYMWDQSNQPSRINDVLVLENDATYGIVWALIDPIFIEYTSGGTTYRRAIRNKVELTTLF
jgi:hypothetical protein